MFSNIYDFSDAQDRAFSVRNAWINDDAAVCKRNEAQANGTQGYENVWWDRSCLKNYIQQDLKRQPVSAFIEPRAAALLRKRSDKHETLRVRHLKEDACSLTGTSR